MVVDLHAPQPLEVLSGSNSGPALRTMEQSQNLYSIRFDAIDSDERRTIDHQFSCARDSPFPAQHRKIAEHFRLALDLSIDADCGPWVIENDELQLFETVTGCGAKPPNIDRRDKGQAVAFSLARAALSHTA